LEFLEQDLERGQKVVDRVLGGGDARVAHRWILHYFYPDVLAWNLRLP
jgi:hypothetical protein